MHNNPDNTALNVDLEFINFMTIQTYGSKRQNENADDAK